MSFVSDKNGKLILRNGKLFVGAPEDSICACCKCCWEISSVNGCPAPSVTLGETGDVSVTFLDSVNCEPEHCKVTDEQLSDKTPCNLPQGVSLSKKWVIKETTSVTVSIIASVSAKGDWGLWYGGAAAVSISSCLGSFSVVGSSLDPGDPVEEPDPENPSVCPMKTINIEETFELKPACWTVSISTGGAWLGANMKNAYTSISFSFDGGGPETCENNMCSTVTCNNVLGSPYGECITTQVDPESGETIESIDDCINNCSSDCQEQTYYCCTLPNKDAVLKECTEFKYRICDQLLPPLELSDTGPYYPSKGACQQDDENDCRITFNCENYECIPVIGHGGEYDTINDCRAVCDPPEKKYECNKNYECIESTNPDAPYETIEDCIADCEEAPKKYSCSPSGECYENPNGSYNNYNDCIGDPVSPCYTGDNDQGYYCCYDNVADLATSATCRLGPCDNPAWTAFGPSSIGTCSYRCQKFTCSRDLCDIGSCKPDPNGSYISLPKCVQSCQTNPPPNKINEDCGFDDMLIQGPGEYEITTNKSPKRICISYRSINDKPVKVNYSFVNPNNCSDPNGNISRRFAPWIGNKDCICDNPIPPNVNFQNFDESNSRSLVFVKPLGVTSIMLSVWACPETELEVTVGCGSCQGDIGGADPDKVTGGCCVEDPADGIVKCLADMVTKAECAELEGKWFGSCVKCDEESDEVDCETDFWACCDGGNCENTTEVQCNKRKAVAAEEDKPFIIFYKNLKCMAADNPSGLQVEDIECPLPENRGACCFQDWKQIGVVSTIEVVDQILVDGIPIGDTETIECPLDESYYPCEYGTANVEVTKKTLHILSINLNAFPYLSPGLFPKKTVVTDIVLPYSDCDGTGAGGGTYTSTEVIPLNNEMFVESYSPPWILTTNTSNVSIGAQVSDQQDLDSLNMTIHSIVAVVDGDGIIQALYTNYSNCQDDVLEEDCGKGNPMDPFGGLADKLAAGDFAKQKKCSDIDCDTYIEDNIFNKVSLMLNMEDLPVSINSFEAQKIAKPKPVSLVKRQTPATHLQQTEMTYESGPGTELKKLLKNIGITATKTCSCNSRAKTMDKWGPDICEQRIEEILGWLREEASKRKLPFIDMVGRLLIKRAIRNARKKL